MKTILTSEHSARMTTDTNEIPFARVIGVGAREGAGELTVRVELRGDGGSEEKALLLPFELMDLIKIDRKNIPFEINEEMLDALVLYDATAHALHRAYGIISYGACSYSKLYRKLREKGVENDAAELAMNIVKDKGYIDENGLAERVCELALKKYWGRSRILRKLREDGYCEEAIEYAVEYLDEVNFAEQCAALIEKRYKKVPADRYEMQKMFASISRYGYSGSEIKEAVKIYNLRR